MSDETLTLYWLPHCSTCQKAVHYLEKKGHVVAEFRDIKSEPLNRKEIERLNKLVDGVGELFSRRARKYRALNLSDRELSSDEMIEFMVEEYTFIKRPVLVCGQRAIAGFTSGSYDGFLETV